MTASKRLNTRTEQNTEDTGLLTYRVLQVELAVKDLTITMGKQKTITPDDLKTLQETIVTRFLDMSNNLQKQIDTKASSSELSDFKKQMYALVTFLSSGALLVFGYLLSKG
jgi:hypothetical protein